MPQNANILPTELEDNPQPSTSKENPLEENVQHSMSKPIENRDDSKSKSEDTDKENKIPVILRKKKKIKCLGFYIELSHQIKSPFKCDDEVLQFAEVLDPKLLATDAFPSLMPIINRFPILCNYVEKLNAEWHLLRNTEEINNQ
ncbi:hypothetical protein ILUMI_06878 [Ignelater luminosus]|uniref:Uncharacterized protein n=1 Tax=Ignelater luminosus TaxID=2038154 RepID=A0A8K0D9T7_IGNLU|nr:hypothetical protein ILUMI_06878 [Ignelater luminosus]